MNCPQCGSTQFKKNGKTSDGLFNRFKCSECGKRWSNSPRKRGGQIIGDRPMSAAERQRKSRERKKVKREHLI